MMSDYEDDILEGFEDPNRVANMAEDLNEMLEESRLLEESEQDDDGDLLYEDEVGEYEDSEIEEPPSYYKLGDYEIPASQVDDVVNLVQWASSLSPEQADQINRALAGEVAAASQVADVEPASNQPSIPSYIEELESSDPTMARYMREMYEERIQREQELETRLNEVMGELTALEGITGERIYAETQQEVAQVEENVRNNFLAEYGLDDEDYDLLVATAGELNITNSMVQAYGMEEGFRKTLETALYANEDLRNRSVSNEVESRLVAEQTSSRKEAAAGLAPQGGTNLPTSTPAGLPQSERRSAMVRDIEALLGMQP
jgi:hypothetical protein